MRSDLRRAQQRVGSLGRARRVRSDLRTGHVATPLLRSARVHFSARAMRVTLRKRGIRVHIRGIGQSKSIGWAAGVVGGEVKV